MEAIYLITILAVLSICMVLFHRNKQLRQNQVDLKETIREHKISLSLAQIDQIIITNRIELIDKFLLESKDAAKKYNQIWNSLHMYYNQSARQSLINLYDELLAIQKYCYVFKCFYGNRILLDVQNPREAGNFFIKPMILLRLFNLLITDTIKSANLKVVIVCKVDKSTLNIITCFENGSPAHNSLLYNFLSYVVFRYTYLSRLPVRYTNNNNQLDIAIPLLSD